MDPWVKEWGANQGRIEPIGVLPMAGDYVMCLGSDVSGKRAILKRNDYIEISQTAELGSNTIARFNVKTRGAPQDPFIVKVGSVTHPETFTIRAWIDGIPQDISYSTESADVIVNVSSGLADAINAISGLTAWVVGSGNMVQIEIDDVDQLFDVDVVAGSITAGSAWWMFEYYIGTTLRASQRIRAGLARSRIDGGAMVYTEQQAGGSHKMAFRLALKSDLSGAIAEIELPAVYVDNITLS